MTAEQGDRRDEDWLRGLAGAPADAAPSTDFEQGRRLRAGLDRVPEADAPTDGWADVLQRAGQGRPVVVEPAPGRRAANTRWAYGLAASVLLAVGLGGVWWPADEPQWRGTTAGTAAAQWLSADPAADAQRLAAELRGWGAAVAESSGTGHERWLDIRCAAPCDPRVAARLAELETALAPDGRLRLRVAAR